MASVSRSRIVIVGGGFAGLATAVRMAEAGATVTLLEATQLGAEASTRNQGWLHSGAVFVRETRGIELARRCYRSLVQTLEFCPESLEYGHIGMLYLFARPDSPTAPWEKAWKQAGLPFRTVPPDELQRLLPGLATGKIQQARLLPDRAFRPTALLHRLADAARQAGVEVRQNCPVSGLRHDEHCVQGVITVAGDVIPAECVVLATGALTGRYWRQPLTPTIGGRTTYSRLVFKTHLVATTPALTTSPFCVPDCDGFNHLPHGDRSIFGSMRWKQIDDPLDLQVDPAETELLWKTTATLFPGMSTREASRRSEWAGTTQQLVPVNQFEPGETPLPTVVDHRFESPPWQNLWSISPGRATLWSQLAEEACRVILTDLGHSLIGLARPRWGEMA